MTQRSDGKDFFLPDFCQAQSILFLVLIAELLVMLLVLFETTFLRFDWASLALSSLFVQWLALSSAAILCRLRVWLMNFSVRNAVCIAYTLILSITLLYSLIAELTIHDYNLSLDGSKRIARNLLMSAIVTGIGFRYFYLSNQLRLQEKSELTSRIQALQSRIRPHFLFNSMNIIASLIPVNPRLAEEVVEDLARLFRASLQEATAEPVSLEEELELCRKYLHIEGLRLADRLKVEFELEVDPSDLRIPLLTLQPLLENAIYHGIQPLPEGGKITLNLKVIEDSINIIITNPFLKSLSTQTSGNRMALNNIRSRLQAICGPKSNLTTEVFDGIYITRLNYPKIEEPLT